MSKSNPASGKRVARTLSAGKHRRRLASAYSIILIAIVGLSAALVSLRRVSADTTTPVSISTFGSAVTQDFNTLVQTGTGTLAANTPPGWGFSESGTNANTSYTAGTGSGNAGDTYSFGSAALPADRALGQLRSGSLISILGATFKNDTGGTINSLNIGYTGEQWRLGATGRTIAERMDFQYSTNATSLTTGTWIDVDALDFIPPVTSGTVGALDGNANHVILNSNITGLNISAGATFWIRWTDVDATGADDGLAVDDFSITANGVVATNPSGTGSASPSSVFPGDSTLLTVNVIPGNNPPSTGLAVVADLSSIGGSPTQSFSGSGNTFTFNATVANNTTPGAKTIPFTISDAQSRSGSGSISLTVKTLPPPNNVVISQVYGGGGNTGADFKNDFIELINHSSAPVNLNGWSVQYASATLSNWQVTPLPNFTLQPGQYLLIQEAAGLGGTTDLPTPDVIGAIAIGAGAGKIALVNNTTLLNSTCPDPSLTGIVDFVAYDATANCFEGSGAAPTLGNTTAGFRRNEGCFDTNNNTADFTAGEPNPRNSSSPFHDCTALSAYGAANPSSVLQGESSTLSVFVAAAQNPASSGITVVADLSAIGGSATQGFTNSGNNVFTFTASVPVNQAPGMKSFPVTVADAESRTTSTNIVLSVLPVIADHLTISQVYGGGGNSGASFRNDFVQLHNPTASPVDVGGWTIQYASATGTTWQVQPLGGVIPPGGYYLISLASGGANGALLPPANVEGSINMSATTGKVALSNSGDAFSDCPLGDPTLVDLVGYGTADCHEGAADAPGPSATAADLRKNNGDTDSDRNNQDFVAGAPNPSTNTPIVEIGPYVLNVDPRKNSTGAPHDTSLTISFTEPVDVVGSWYNINCGTTGLHNDGTVAHTNDFKTYVITPNVNFQFGELCTATIFQNGVHDQDTDDSAPGTDTLKADYVWSFTVVGAGQAAPYPPSVHLTMGNPTNAVADVNQPLNYLMVKPTYALSYNRDKGTPNWVSWHLDSSWYGSLARVDSFRPDPAVPPDWYRVQAFDYSGSGFDRGHMTPNADRDNQFRVPINQETYLMSNMVPQAPDNNQGPWAALEGDLRTIADAGNELYIISGPLGVGGTGSNGGTTLSVANGQVTVPAFTWKVALVLPKQNGDDVSRVTCSTRTIAVLMPNVQGIRNNDWHTYLTTVDNIEQQTGYDLYSNLPPAVQACIEAGTDGTNPPGTADQSATTTEDNSVTVTLQGLQPNADPLTFEIISGPASGSLGALSSASCASGTCTATVTYTPGAEFNGTDSFTFRANDGSIHSNTSTVTISVSEVNDSPTAADDSKSTSEDTPLTFPASDLTANDSAGPANEATQALTVTSVTAGANTHGTVGLTSGTVTYNPEANYNGPASFTYTVCDDGTTNGAPDSKCATASVNVTVNAVNDAPTAADDTATTDEDTPVNINVLANDSDVEGDSLTITAVTQGTHGSVTNNGTDVTYSPAANYNGTDSFSYTISDGHGGTATANVNVTINAVNDAPVAVNDSATTDEDTPANINVLANDSDVDGDSLNITAVTQGAHGSVTNNGNNVTYSPAANFHGNDSFSYTVSDGHGGTATANVSVTINSVNDAPVAVGDAAATNEDNAVTIDVVANDTDVDGDALSLQSVGSAAHGAVTIVSGKAVYSPAANFNGPDSFSYVVSDGHGGQATGNVSIIVNPVNDAPTANSQSVSTNSNTPVAITLTGSDVETAPANLIFNVVSGPSHGVLSGTGANRTYTPAPGSCGPDSFQFTVTDTGDGASAPLTSSPATVAINVADSVAPNITLNNLTLIFQGGLKVILNGNQLTVNGQTFTLPNGTINILGHTITRNGANVTVDGQPFTINGQTILLALPNGAYQNVLISDLVASASDGCDGSVTVAAVRIAQVSSDEPENAAGNSDGNTQNDIVIAPDCKSVQLRVERDANHNGRVYSVVLRVRDGAGNTQTVTALVTVPKGAGFGNAVNDPPAYTVNSSCP